MPIFVFELLLVLAFLWVFQSTTWKNPPEAPLMHCFWCVFHSACAVVFLTITDTETFGSHCAIDYRWYVVIDVLGNVLRLFAIDHVLVSLVHLLKTIATTDAIFSL